SVVIHVGTGAIGTSVCDSAHSCYVIVNNASSTDPANTVKVPIRFARSRLLLPGLEYLRAYADT
ncbi:MAG TPA: hypothetical protein VNU75_10170, partial [Acidimicrobiales bacterium]|nr:hypothetical protein [Acidimicrobiales bacterium]